MISHSSTSIPPVSKILVWNKTNVILIITDQSNDILVAGAPFVQPLIIILYITKKNKMQQPFNSFQNRNQLHIEPKKIKFVFLIAMWISKQHSRRKFFILNEKNHKNFSCFRQQLKQLLIWIYLRKNVLEHFIHPRKSFGSSWHSAHFY
jgi:hypothetical protein